MRPGLPAELLEEFADCLTPPDHGSGPNPVLGQEQFTKRKGRLTRAEEGRRRQSQKPTASSTRLMVRCASAAKGEEPAITRQKGGGFERIGPRDQPGDGVDQRVRQALGADAAGQALQERAACRGRLDRCKGPDQLAKITLPVRLVLECQTGNRDPRRDTRPADALIPVLVQQLIDDLLRTDGVAESVEQLGH